MSPIYKGIPINVVLNLFPLNGSLLLSNFFNVFYIKSSWVPEFLKLLIIKICLLIHVVEQRLLVLLRHFYYGDIKATGCPAIITFWDKNVLLV